MSEVAVDVVEITAERVVHLIIEKLAVIFVRWRGRRLGLERCRAGEHRSSGNQKQDDQEFSNVFHSSVTIERASTNRMSEVIPVYRMGNILARSISGYLNFRRFALGNLYLTGVISGIACCPIL